jgi:hypothetical protein
MVMQIITNKICQEKIPSEILGSVSPQNFGIITAVNWTFQKFTAKQKYPTQFTDMLE